MLEKLFRPKGAERVDCFIGPQGFCHPLPEPRFVAALIGEFFA
jgi:hypothetical protein